MHKNKLPNDPTAHLRCKISAREMQVWRLLARGYTNRQIGAELGIAPKTIDSYREHLKTKLGVGPGEPNRLAHLGIRYGLFKVEVHPLLADLEKYSEREQQMRVNAVLFEKEWAKAGIKVSFGQSLLAGEPLASPTTA